MIYDKENLFFDEKAVSSLSATPTYSDAVENGKGGAYPNAPIDIRVTGAQIGGGSLTLKLQTDDDAAFSDPTYIKTGKTFTTSLTLGELHDVIHVPADAKKYIRLEATGSDSLTGDGKLTAGIVVDHDQK